MGLNGCIICAVAKTLRDTQNESNDGKPIIPHLVYYRLKSIGGFEFGRQEDASDFFRSLIGAMKYAFIRNSPAMIDPPSPISEIFSGKQTQTIKCVSCGNESISDRLFIQIILQVNKEMKNLYDAFNLYFDLGHITDYDCTSCKMRATGKQRITI